MSSSGSIEIESRRVRRQAVLRRREGAGENRADGRAGGEDEVQEERPGALDLGAQRHGRAVLIHECHIRQLDFLRPAGHGAEQDEETERRRPSNRSSSDGEGLNYSK